jgi:hypothetical protein
MVNEAKRGCPVCGGTAGFHLSFCTQPLTEEEKDIQQKVYKAIFSTEKKDGTSETKKET